MSVAADEDTEEQRPQRQTPCQSLRRDAHLKCLVLTLLIVGCLAVVTWCRLAEVTRVVVNFQSFPITTRRNVSPCDEGYVYIPVAFLLMLYVVYLVECWHCSTRLELVYRVDASAVYEHIQQMREAQPVIWWKAICYHYVRRTRQVTRYRNGDAYTTTQIYYERINSHASGSCFVYSHCGVRDISKRLVDLEKHPATKIRFSKGFAFANLEAANEFEEQRARFFQDNERYDDYLEMREGLDLVGVNFQEYMVSFANPDSLPWYVSHAVFWVFSLLLLSWPLRVLIDCKTAYVHYQVTKLFGVNYATPSSGTFVPGQLSRGSTVDSSELERHAINNFTIAPSYSEAILMDASGRVLPLRADSNGNIPNGVCPADSSLEDQVTELSDATGARRAKRCSWTAGGSRTSLYRPSIPVSISRTSLLNGQVVYFVPPLQHDGQPLVRRTSAQPVHDENPPTYEDALWFSRPVLLPLRRSVTDRDIPRRQCHLPPRAARRSWESELDVPAATSMETAL